MQLECKECHRTLNLPDDKVPRGRPFAFNCPYCKQKNTALIPEETQAAAPEGPIAAPPPPGADAQEPEAAPAQTQAQAQPAYRLTAEAPPEPLRAGADAEADSLAKAMSDDTDLQSALSEAVDDRPKAMVVFDDPEVQELIIKRLEEGGYNAAAALNPRDAAKQLKFVNFSLLILQENYCGATLHGNLLLRSLQTIDISNRRGMLVILVSPTMTSLDDLTAFGLPIDGIINIADVESIDRLLVSVTARAKKFYATSPEPAAKLGPD
jgi:CheY-like chemotaxis protein